MKYLFVLLMVAGCGTNKDSSSEAYASDRSRCVPNQSITCACEDGKTGAQTCQSTGQAYGSCTCTQEAPEPHVSTDDNDQPHSACVPGRSITCSCQTGSQGAQSCREDGSGYAACACKDNQPSDRPEDPDEPPELSEGEGEGGVPNDPPEPQCDPEGSGDDVIGQPCFAQTAEGTCDGNTQCDPDTGNYHCVCQTCERVGQRRECPDHIRDPMCPDNPCIKPIQECTGRAILYWENQCVCDDSDCPDEEN